MATRKTEPVTGALIQRRGALGPTASRPASTIDQAQKAANRLAALAAVGLVTSLWFTGQMIFGPPIVAGMSEQIRVAAIIACSVIVVLSVVLLVAARRLRLTSSEIYNLGLVYLIMVALVASIARHSPGWHDTVRGIAPISLIVVLFPVLVPCPPARAILAGSAALAASVLAWGITVFAGNELISTIMALRVFQGEILAIPLGLLAADVVHGLGVRLEEARKLGAYELVERLGVGGMGEVWRARHSTLARPAAVKLVRPDTLQISNPDRREALLARFEREALVTASLTSPHTVEVYDFGVEDDGTFFYVMELLDGIDLHEMVARYGTLPPERAVWFLRQACRSLAEAHDRGLVHRDIKPSNLISCRRGDDVDFLKVVDFGLVTPIDPSTLDERFTRMGQAPGTPAYMAPEQARNPLEVDGRADLYSLGCVAFWMLTRSHVFDGPSPYEISRKHAEEAPPTPSSRALYPIPPELDSVILRCLAKDPAQRPRNARVLLGMLAAIPLNEPWTEERAREWWEENRPRRPVEAAPPAVAETAVD